MKWVWISIGVVVLLLCAGVTLWIVAPGKSVISDKDKMKTLQVLLGRTPHLNDDKTPTTWTTYKSHYVQFDYPSWANVYTADNKKAIKSGNLDNFSFNLIDDHIYGVIQVVPFTGKLSEYSAVSLRLAQNDIYTASASMSAKTNSIQFTKDEDNVEKSVFFQRPGEIVSIAVTGFSTQKVESLFTGITSTLKIF